eukprot:scaffold119965_cov115-Phaeocystis_antarctica.AAC.1
MIGKTDLNGTLKLGAAVKTIGTNAFSQTKLTGLDLSQAASLESIRYGAFYETDIPGTLVIPAKFETIGAFAFKRNNNLDDLDLSNAASLESIGDYAFDRTTGTIVTPFTVPAYNAANSFPAGVSIVEG